MNINRNMVSFFSGDPIDKEVQSDPVVYMISAGSPSGRTDTFKIPNKYGKKCFVTASYSINGSDFYSYVIAQQFTASFGPATRMQVTPSCDANYVYFDVYQAYTATQTLTIKYALDTLD